MDLVHGIEELAPALGRLFIVVGVFDGLHLGHQYLLGELVNAARRLDARPAVLTFDHHPDEVITGAAPPLLCDPGERLRRLESAGVEVTIVQHFDQSLRETAYDAFIGRIADRVDLAGFLMTPESAFGFERRGTPETVEALGRDMGYEVIVAPSFTLDGRAVTSSAVRAAIAAGDLAEAARLLGRRVTLVGIVEPGLGDTTRLSFPMPVALPPMGRYDSLVHTSGGSARRGTLEVGGGGVHLAPAVPMRADAVVEVELVGLSASTAATAVTGA